MRLRTIPFTMVTLLVFTLALSAQQSKDFYPDRYPNWETKTPTAMGIDANLLKEAIEFAQANESESPKDLEMAHYQGFGREPFGYAVGPFKVRGPQTGIIIKNGYIIAEWGEPHRVDMTFSVSKTFLSSVVGLAYDRGLIKDVNDKVYEYMAPVVPFEPYNKGMDNADHFGKPDVLPLFENEHNKKITWDHLLRQTSAWKGTLWGKPDWADRPSRDRTTWYDEEKAEPGTEYEYNDTRVNLLALCATNVWRRPLPEVLRDNIMDPIGASVKWRWHGYENSWVVIDGAPIQAVSGGGHWGGGMFLTARDQARLGLLTLRNGRWKDQQILSEEWIKMSKTPGTANKGYGYMNYFLNGEEGRYKNVPATSWSHIGAGTNMVYCDPENDLVIVARWIKGGAIDEFLDKVITAIK
ncbi:MAG: serine hydrolase [Bacteroidota bacterium]